MGKSPAKWINIVLLGKKSTKSSATKTNESNAANNNGYLTGEELAPSGNSPVISQPVLVNAHKSGPVSDDGKAESSNLPRD
ncbi:hypothetical protein EJB05_17884 [Eragrostis curvula]|uniref:Uncharacterized protein n=1 Tax=Eragrostis curvula TaxID=38414 RepID=A0A5J9VKK8_9POAL|nr:hypothetical protein EJB05_17884 [Eragrostis curvula]